MKLGRVIGTAVSTIKVQGLNSHKLLLVADFDPSAEASENHQQADLLIAIDLVGAGADEVVLLTTGSAARLNTGSPEAPVDTAIIAILDNVQIDGTTVYEKR